MLLLQRIYTYLDPMLKAAWPLLQSLRLSMCIFCQIGFLVGPFSPTLVAYATLAASISYPQGSVQYFYRNMHAMTNIF